MKSSRFLYIMLLFAAGAILNYVYADVVVVGDLSHEKTAQPGEIYTGEIILQNFGEEPEQVRVYQEDYIFFADGSGHYPEPGTIDRSNSSWITFSPKQVYIVPEEKSIVHYKVEVPEADTLTGTFWSMLIIEPLREIVPESTEGIKIHTVMRYGIQMITHIGGTGIRDIQFSGTKLIREEDKLFLQVDIKNVGERMLVPKVWAELYDESGNLIGPFESGLKKTYPGTSIRKKIDISTASSGNYKAMIIADCGEDDLFGIQYDIKIDVIK